MNGPEFSDPDRPSSAKGVWNPREVEKAIEMEQEVPLDGKEHSKKDIARKTITENAALLAAGLVHTAIHSENESLRTKAQMYLLDRIFGKVSDVPIDATKDEQSLQKLLAGVAVPDDASELTGGDNSGSSDLDDFGDYE